MCGSSIPLLSVESGSVRRFVRSRSASIRVDGAQGRPAFPASAAIRMLLTSKHGPAARKSDSKSSFPANALLTSPSRRVVAIEATKSGSISTPCVGEVLCNIPFHMYCTGNLSLWHVAFWEQGPHGHGRSNCHAPVGRRDCRAHRAQLLNTLLSVRGLAGGAGVPAHAACRSLRALLHAHVSGADGIYAFHAGRAHWVMFDSMLW